MKNWRIAKRFRVKKKIPVLNLELETKTVEMEVRKFEVAPYEVPTDSEMIEGLNECGYYAEACRIEELKKKNAVLKGKLTKLTKKSDAYKDDLDRANGAIRQLLKEKHGTK